MATTKVKLPFKEMKANLWAGTTLRTDGTENLLETGAKAKYLGGGWWLVWGYHYGGKDVAPYHKPLRRKKNG